MERLPSQLQSGGRKRGSVCDTVLSKSCFKTFDQLKIFRNICCFLETKVFSHFKEIQKTELKYIKMQQFQGFIIACCHDRNFQKNEVCWRGIISCLNVNNSLRFRQLETSFWIYWIYLNFIQQLPKFTIPMISHSRGFFKSHQRQ